MVKFFFSAIPVESGEVSLSRDVKRFKVDRLLLPYHLLNNLPNLPSYINQLRKIGIKELLLDSGAAQFIYHIQAKHLTVKDAIRWQQDYLKFLKVYHPLFDYIVEFDVGKYGYEVVDYFSEKIKGVVGKEKFIQVWHYNRGDLKEFVKDKLNIGIGGLANKSINRSLVLKIIQILNYINSFEYKPKFVHVFGVTNPSLLSIMVNKSSTWDFELSMDSASWQKFPSFGALLTTYKSILKSYGREKQIELYGKDFGLLTSKFLSNIDIYSYVNWVKKLIGDKNEGKDS